MRNTLLITTLLAVPLWTSCTKPAGANAGGRPPTQVVAVPAKQQPVAQTISLVGSLLPAEMVEIKAEIEGKVEKILFKEGQAVTNDQLLIQLDESKLSKDVAESEANYKLRQSTYERDQKLFADKLISEEEFDQSFSQYQVSEAVLELRRRRLRDTRIVAPFDGVIGTRRVSPGQVIERNTLLTWVMDIDPVQVEVNVPERFLGQLETGQVVTVHVEAYPDESFTGKVFFISSFVDQDLRTALVKAVIGNPSGRLKPGMFANLDLTLSIREAAVVVPESALARLLEGNQATLFVVSNETAQMRRVTLGVRLPGKVEILDGVKAGEEVIVEGTQKLGPDAPIQLAPPEAAAPYLHGP